MKKLITSLLLLIPLLTNAYDVQIDGIYYNLIPEKNEAEVTYCDNNYNSYSGSVTIPEKFTCEGVVFSVMSIGDRAFQDCSSLTFVTIPNSVISIGDFAFFECSSLTSISIPNSVISIGNSAFSGCSRLTSVTIPNSVTSIGKRVFYECRRLTSVTIPNSLMSIGEEAFLRCYELTSVTIPNSVTSIGEYNQEIKGETNVVIIPVIA